MRELFFILLLSLTTFFAYSQENPKIEKKTFFDVEEGKDAAKGAFKIAEKYYNKGNGTYDEALKYYLKLYDYNPNSDALNYKIAACYLWTSNKQASLEYLLQSTPEVARDYYLALGRSYQYSLMFEEAKEAYSNYLATLRSWEYNDIVSYIDQLKSECDISEDILQDSLSAFIINLGPIINTYYDEYGACLLGDENSGLLFTSKRPKKQPNQLVSRFSFKERILWADKNKNEKYESVKGLPKIDFRVNTSIAGINPAEKRIYFYKGERHNGRLFTAVFQDGVWKKIKPLKGGINHIAHKESSITFDSDGTAYFVTDRKGGIGGKDIWFAFHKGGQKYEKAVNLGWEINTPFDEEGVHLSSDGNTLYFSSNGHPGMGGFDVYKAVRQNNGTWGNPINMGHPINSPADELFYKTTADSMVSIYATVRPDSYGGMDIYKIQLDPRIPFTLTGTVTDLMDDTVLPASINIYDSETQQLLKSTSIDTISGKYQIDFEDVGGYFIQVDFEGYKSVTKDIECPTKKYTTKVENFSIEKLRHPFSLVGRVSDLDKDTPLMTSLTFKLASEPDSIIGRAVSDAITGKYSVTFEDKYDMIILVNAEDYFQHKEPLNVLGEITGMLSKNILLKRSKIEYTLAGRISDDKNTIPVSTPLNFYKPGEEQAFITVVSDSTNGNYSVTIEEQGPFLIELEADGYFFYSEIYQFPEGQTYVSKNIALIKLEVGVKFVVENILFNTGKATMKMESFDEVDKLANLLRKNEKVRIEVSGHTDNVGSVSLNKKLSKDRALTVKNFLVSRGIEQDRIEYEGYGFDQPIAPNTTSEGKAKNRRVEVKILE